jgi:hypothetical protein
LYEKATNLPEPGTPLESLFLLVWRSRQDIRLMETRAVVQALMASNSESKDAQKNLLDAWTDYSNELFPFQRGTKRRSDDAEMSFFKKETKGKSFRVIPLAPVGRIKSRVKRK